MNIFISGGSRGLGAELVKIFALNNHNVAFSYLSNSKLATNLIEEIKLLNSRVKIFSYQLDLKLSTQVDSTVEQCIQEMQNIDLVIANAAISKNSLLISMQDSDWDEVIQTNLTGNFYLSRAFLEHYIQNKCGKFLFISSSTQSGSSGQVAYACAKAGLAALSSTISKEYSSRGISSNLIIPGGIETDMLKETGSDKLEDFWLQNNPQRRFASSKEIAQAIYTISQIQSNYLNSSEIRIDGGLNWLP